MKAVRLKRHDGTLSKPFFDEQALRRSVNARLHHFVEPMNIVEPGVVVGPKKNRGEIAARFTQHLITGDVGLHLVVQDASDKRLHGRTVQTAPTPANTTGSPGVDLLVGFLNQVFPGQWESWGCYVYKHISGSSTWSDHAYVNPAAQPPWCGRAIDVHPHSIAIGDDIETRAKAEPSIAHELRYILWRGVPDHFPGHLHFSFEDGGYPGAC